MASRTKKPEFIAVIEDSIFRTLMACHVALSEDEASILTDALTTNIVGSIAGQMMYVPVLASTRREEQRKAIWSAFTGDNAQELATRFECSIQHVYRVVAAMRLEKRRPLPGSAE